MKKFLLILMISILSLTACSKSNNNVDDNDNKKEDIIDNKKEENEDLIPNSDKDNKEVNHVEKHKLEVVQSIQENGYYCVPATVQMALSYNGIQMSQDELALKLNTSSVTGTEYIELANVLNLLLFNKDHVEVNEAGYHIQTFEPNAMTSNDLNKLEKRIISNVETKDFTFVAVNMNALYSNMPVANHMILIVGYDIDTQSNTVTDYLYIDPYPEVQDTTYGGLKTISPANLMEAINSNEEPAYVY